MQEKGILCEWFNIACGDPAARAREDLNAKPLANALDNMGATTFNQIVNIRRGP